MKAKAYEIGVQVQAYINGKDVWRVAQIGIIARGITGIAEVVKKLHKQYQCTDYRITIKQRGDL